MSQYQQVFKRYEKKYALTHQQYQKLLFRLNNQMTADAYGQHLIQNIYFDNDRYDLIRDSLSKPLYKEKLRIRCYGQILDDDPVFIEIKKKYRGVVYKRRIRMHSKAAMAFTEGLMSVDEAFAHVSLSEGSNALQVLSEIEWMIKRYQLEPKVYISYWRKAYSGNEDPEFRVTFDSNLCYREQALYLESHGQTRHFDRPITTEPLILMEVKAIRCMPLWFTKLLSELEIYPQSFSKYGTCYTHHLMIPDHQGGKIYA